MHSIPSNKLQMEKTNSSIIAQTRNFIVITSARVTSALAHSPWQWTAVHQIIHLVWIE